MALIANVIRIVKVILILALYPAALVQFFVDVSSIKAQLEFVVVNIFLNGSSVTTSNVVSCIKRPGAAG